jgi:hypothetical protein
MIEHVASLCPVRRGTIGAEGTTVTNNQNYKIACIQAFRGYYNELTFPVMD